MYKDELFLYTSEFQVEAVIHANVKSLYVNAANDDDGE